MDIYHDTISIKPQNCFISKDYDIINVTGHQYCFVGALHSYESPYISKVFPICLFNGKKEGDTVVLNFDVKPFSPFTMIVVCNQSDCKYKRLGSFEQALYDLSYEHAYRTDVYCYNAYHKLSIYNTHVAYAKSINLPSKLKYKTYEPILLIDYITIGCIDIHGLLKDFYYALFVEAGPIAKITVID